MTHATDARLAALLDAVEEYAIFLLDTDGNVVSWNSGARRIKGYDDGEIVGRHFSVFYTDEDRAAGRPAAALEHAARSGVYREEGWRVRRDGSRLWANVLLRSLHDEDGRLEGFAKITRDESGRRESEHLARQLEMLTERDRIAEELRETVVRRIFDASLTLQGALRLVRDPAPATRIQAALDSLDDTLKHIRTTVVGLLDE